MVKVKSYTMNRKGSKRKIKLYSNNDEVFFTKPDSDGRTSEWWGSNNPQGGRSFTLMAGLSSPKWLKDLFGGKK